MLWIVNAVHDKDKTVDEMIAGDRRGDRAAAHGSRSAASTPLSRAPDQDAGAAGTT